MKPSEYSHVNVCKNAINDDKIFDNFKRNNEYKKILEHTSELYGYKNLELIINLYEKYCNIINWEKLKENDILGNPELCVFNDIKRFSNMKKYEYSPSTMNYIFKGLDIIDKILINNENEINIIEIGGGYGGQCKILIDLCDSLNIKLNSYGIIDLEYVSKFQKKYLSNFNYNNIEYFEYENIKNFNVFQKYNILLSVYALGEFDIDIQNFYIKNILFNISQYYIVWNTNTINEFFLNNKNTIIDSVPKTEFFCKTIYNK